MTAETAVERARSLVAPAQRITVLTGAGVSTASGIPDFRGPSGIWTRNPEAARAFDLEAYLGDPDVRRTAWAMRRDNPALTARPNSAHHAIAGLHRQGRLLATVTQNIDGLHQAAGCADVIEVHGTIHETRCVSCHDRMPTSNVIVRLDAGEEDPSCLHCGGILKVATILFGESLDRAVLARATEAARECDVLLAAGTSLQVYPAAGLVDVAAAAGAPIVIVNGQETPYDALASAIVRTPIEECLPVLLA